MEPFARASELQTLMITEKSVETVVPMVVPLEHWLQQRLSSWVQLSGHKGTIIPASEKTLWKKCGKVGDNFEAQAYCKLMNDICQPFVPKFYKEVEYCGECIKNLHRLASPFIEIEDLTRMFDNPAIMDIKLGTRTFLESEVSNSKKRSDLFQKMIQLDPTEPTLEENEEKAITKLRYMQFRERESSSASLGFRIDGIKLIVVMMQFLNLEKSNIFLARAIDRLKELRTVVEKSLFFACHEVIGSSLLILYDDQMLNIFLIDFAKAIPLPFHVDGGRIRIDHRSPWTLSNKEDGYLTGLDNLIEILESMSAK
uniref:Kinase n=1 Tax=Romanomermis culicivorax TaxID=13658 RepID=A0A915INT0_ROMCU